METAVPGRSSDLIRIGESQSNNCCLASMSNGFRKVVYILTGIALLGVCVYTCERLYVTPTEAVNHVLDISLRSMSNENFRRLNRQLHDDFFSSSPPDSLNRLLLSQSTAGSPFTKQKLRDALDRFFSRVPRHRHIVMSRETRVRNGTAEVDVKILTLYQKDDENSADRLPQKFISSWTLRFKQEQNQWKIVDLTYGQ